MNKEEFLKNALGDTLHKQELQTGMTLYVEGNEHTHDENWPRVICHCEIPEIAPWEFD